MPFVASVAQWIEHHSPKVGVVSSILIRGTFYYLFTVIVMRVYNRHIMYVIMTMKDVFFMVVSTVARINFRTDEKTKQDAEVLFNALGLDMSTALNMFLKQAVREQALPISPSLVTPVPNEATLKAMNHANQIIDGKIAEDGIVFSNANEAKAFLDNMS